MSTSTGDHFEIRLAVEAELSMIESSRPEEAADLPAAEWLFDPIDVQRRKVELCNLLGAVKALRYNVRYRPDDRQ